MDLIDHLQSLASKIQKQREQITTEEGTKHAFVMPFIHALGYDVFDPTEVVPEFTTDVGIKSKEKVDYAIVKDDKVIMLFECKGCGCAIDRKHASQLFRYFTATESRIGVLTNGINYEFYTDLEQPNKMDDKPFMEFNLLDINEALIPEIKKLTKSRFNLEETISAAEELKYTRGVRRVIEQEMLEPSHDLVRVLVSQVYTSTLTKKRVEHFTPIVKKAFQALINDRINDRIKSALAEQTDSIELAETPEEIEEKISRVETSHDEQEAYMIVKSIIRRAVEADRISSRDTISYFGVLLDDNNRKPICRLHFNRAQKYIGLFDQGKAERRLAIGSLDDIFEHAEALLKTVAAYDTPGGAEIEEEVGAPASEPVESESNDAGAPESPAE